MEQKTSHRELTNEELTSFNEAFIKFQKDQQITLRAIPHLVPNEKGEFTLTAQFLVYKKVENEN